MHLRITLIISVVSFLIVALVPHETKATIYTFVDENGSIHLTNVPVDPRYKPAYDTVSRFNKRRPEDRYEYHILNASQRFEIDRHLIKAVIKVESNYNRRAVSKKGAMGLMQLMPETARDMELADPFNAADNIVAGTRYLKKMLTLFEGDLKLALAAYNAGPEIIKRIRRIPNYPETTNYVRKVLTHYYNMKEREKPARGNQPNSQNDI